MIGLAAALLVVAAGAAPVSEAADVPGECAPLVRTLEERSADAKKHPVDELRTEALVRLDDLRGLEGAWVGNAPVHLPWLDMWERSVNRADSSETLSELMLFASHRLAQTCRNCAAPVVAPAKIDRERLTQILSRPEYDLSARDDTMVMRLIQRLRIWFRDVFAVSRGVTEAANWVRGAFLLGVCALVALLAFRISRRRSRRRDDAAAPLPVGALVLEDPVRYERAAEDALGRGDGREALRNSWLSLLAAFERLRLATPGRTFTNRELAERLEVRGASHSLADATRALVAEYDRAWYGVEEVSSDAARTFDGRVKALRATALKELEARA